MSQFFIYIFSQRSEKFEKYIFCLQQSDITLHFQKTFMGFG